MFLGVLEFLCIDAISCDVTRCIAVPKILTKSLVWINETSDHWLYMWTVMLVLQIWKHVVRRWFSPGCPRSSIALQVQNRSLKHPESHFVGGGSVFVRWFGPINAYESSMGFRRLLIIGLLLGPNVTLSKFQRNTGNVLLRWRENCVRNDNDICVEALVVLTTIVTYMKWHWSIWKT